MSRRGDDTVARARALIGVRFRAQGRGSDGLDCVGLAAAALEIAGVREDYALRSSSDKALATSLRRLGLIPIERREPGDLLVMCSGAGQLHLGIWTGAGLVHADAGLRRVVERPAPVPWRVLSAWRPAPVGEPEGGASPWQR
jgi:cell wall-associated NlpC family hydrolase